MGVIDTSKTTRPKEPKQPGKSETMLVRASREGDQFHYVWAARRCLRLLLPATNLVAVSIEGASSQEDPNDEAASVGEEVIDVGEYFGSEHAEQATLIRYIQLKHSTLHENSPWQPSGLKRTLSKFASLYKDFQKRVKSADSVGRREFWFVSNRPVATTFLEAIEDASSGAQIRHPGEHSKLEHFTGLKGADLAKFGRLLRMEVGQEGYWEQRHLLNRDVSGYLPDADADGPIQLKEMVTVKALSRSLVTPSIYRLDVLRALKTDENGLLPARCLIEPLTDAVPREQETDLVNQIIAAKARPVLLHAAGGVGKTVISSRIHLLLPPQSACILYDCFGDGEYRNPSRYRHRHKTGLTQIANELAGNGWCDPLVPSPHADGSSYLTAFLHRLDQAIATIKCKNPEALICIVVDAADNAQIAAEEISEPRSFVRDLLRVKIPEGVRLVALCRTERRSVLDPPPKALHLELRPFSWAESALHLRLTFPDATDRDVDEFHALSSQNPRVQAMALSGGAQLQDVLSRLGPNPTTVEAAIEDLLEAAIEQLRDSSSASERTNIDRLCAGLAILRPRIPISVLAAISGVEAAFIRSFAVHLGRPIRITGESIQFFDEPAETWFRTRFKANRDTIRDFLKILTPLATSSSYIASTVPALMMEADQLLELVNMALSSEGLPETNKIDRRDIEVQRLHFALRACLRLGRHTDAAKLALKAGGESAGHGREASLLQANTDLAGSLLDADRLQDLVARSSFQSGWTGSHHAYEASLMSGADELIGEARSRLRMAEDWLRNWVRLSKQQRQLEEVSALDIAVMAMTHFKVDGPPACAHWFRRWKPRDVSFRAGRVLAQRFVDHGRFQDLEDLANAAGNDFWLVLAITHELRRVNRRPSEHVIKRTLRILLDRHVAPRTVEPRPNHRMPLGAVVAVAEAACQYPVFELSALAQLLDRQLPDFPPRELIYSRSDERGTLIRAYTLLAALRNKELRLDDLAPPELHRGQDTSFATDSQEPRAFRSGTGVLLPWYQLWAKVVLRRTLHEAVPVAIANAKSTSESRARTSYEIDRHAHNEIAQLWLDILIASDCTDRQSLAALNQWIDSLGFSLFPSTLTSLARSAGKTPSISSIMTVYARRSFDITRNERDDAQSKTERYLDLARAMLSANKSEATEYFDQAVEVASKIGDENQHRWTALLDLADAAGDRSNVASKAAYDLARCAELTYEYVVRDKHFDWISTVRSIATLCPSSSLSILSRWRDRQFGETKYLLPEIVTFLIARGDLDGRTAIALLGFRANWDLPELLSSALAASANIAEKEKIVSFALRYIALRGHNGRTWQSLLDLLTSENIANSAVADFVALAPRKDPPTTMRTERDDTSPRIDPEPIEWGSIFEGTDLTSAESISSSIGRLRDARMRFSLKELFIEEAFKRVPSGKESGFILALSQVKDFTLHELKVLLESIPDAWMQQLSVSKAVVEVLKKSCRRFALEIEKGRYYSPFPFDLASRRFGFSAIQVADNVLLALAEETEPLDAKRLFSLTNLLALKLSKREALTALTFGLGLFEDQLSDTDGDGSWSERIVPPTEVEGALAGYVWASLGAPSAATRWEAAHVVRGFCALKRERALEHLVSLDIRYDGGPFVDTAFHFYKMHARQWLLIALARAAKEHPRSLVPYSDHLTELAMNGTTHVLIRKFAAAAMLELYESGVIARNRETESRLSKINISSLPVVSSKRYEWAGRSMQDSAVDAEAENDTLYFNVDVVRSWFSPLGHCFGRPASDVKQAVKRVLRGRWKYSGRNRWDEDERHKRKLFKGVETSESESNPPTHDLSFYRTYHAVMEVAGEWLTKFPTHVDPENSWDCFDEWLAEKGLSRTDGRWLADRRDPNPLERPLWTYVKSDVDWRWSLMRGDFDGLLVSPGHIVNIWGDWTEISSERVQSVSVRSALASPGRSRALLRALQTAEPYLCRFPAAGSDDEIAFGEFELKGWVEERTEATGLDKRDPWAGSINYPPPRPAGFVVDLMGISSDLEQRDWINSLDPEKRIALSSRIWGDLREDGTENGEHGSRLQASRHFIAEFLSKTRQDLIVKVQISRTMRHTRYGGLDDIEFRYPKPSARFFLFGHDGGIYTS